MHEQKKLLADHIEESSHIIGFKPITEEQLDEMADSIRKDPTTKDKKDNQTIYRNAAINLVKQFIKENLKMSERDRNSLKINSIFQSKKENTNILYIRCDTTDDISLITSHLKNMDHSNLKNAPTTITHIPRALYKRFQHCEKLLYKLRITNEKKIQTNLRLGRLDFQLRQRTKGDKTPWKDLPILKIPNSAPGPELELLDEEEDEIQTEKSNRQTEDNEVDTEPNEDNEPTEDTEPPEEPESTDDNYSTSQEERMESTHMSDTHGSIAGHLQNKQKHSLSASISPTQERKKSKTDHPNFNLSLPNTAQPMSPESQIRKYMPTVTIQKVDNTNQKQKNK